MTLPQPEHLHPDIIVVNDEALELHRIVRRLEGHELMMNAPCVIDIGFDEYSGRGAVESSSARTIEGADLFWHRSPGSAVDNLLR